MNFLKSTFTDKIFWRNTANLALPIALQNLLSSSFALVDTLMIGSLGEISVAAVGLASQIAFLLNLFLFGICSGGAVFASQAWGAKNIKSIRTTFGIILSAGTILAFGFFAMAFFAPEFCMGLLSNDPEAIGVGTRYLKIASFSYFGVMLTNVFSTVLRSTEQVKIPLFSNIAAVLMNVFFNYALIFGKFGLPQMGIEGAALATVISAITNALVIYLFSLIRREVIACKPSEMFDFGLDALKRFAHVALPVFLNEALWALGTTVCNAIFGRMGSDNFAALTISRTVENFIFVFFVGLCNACAVMIGKCIGEGNTEKAKTYSRRFLLLEPVVGVILALVLLPLRKGVLSLFDFGEASFTTAYLLLTVYCMELVLRNIPYITIVGCFRAGGDTRRGMLYDLICLWGVAIPVTYVLGLVIGADFVLTYFIMLVAEDVVKNVLCLRHFFSFKWIKPSVANDIVR